MGVVRRIKNQKRRGVLKYAVITKDGKPVNLFNLQNLLNLIDKAVVSQCRISYILDILIILLGGFVVVEGEAFARPAQEEPQTAEENEKL